ncbi:Ribosome-recycling factor, chloroplastic [Frankliniella fusca]|uniref:Ribosome-recycling factor, chloroplastic n=1 Tax=Frankliniella fusca TaxID=407009 RepID=A0AAE1I4Z7_9NEOP|nr:Ribosome-recycling factor, chloroplastic [Frankliniella fusca]
MKSYAISRRNLVQAMKEKASEGRQAQKNSLRDMVINNFSSLNRNLEITDQVLRDLSTQISYFANEYFKRWDPFHGREDDFLRKHKSWLDTIHVFESKNPLPTPPPSPASKPGPGRPVVDFNEAAPRTKRLKSEAVRKGQTVSSLSHATAMQLRVQGKTAAAQLVQKIGEDPSVADHILQVYNQYQAYTPPQKMSGEEAVALIVHLDLSKGQYITLREKVAQHGADIFPCYNTVLSAKKACTPPSLIVTETSAEVPLQSLVDHNTRRLVGLLERSVPSPFDNLEGPVELEMQ